MKMSQNGIKTLKQLEGFENTIYVDVAGLATIGVGHLLTKSELASGKIHLTDGSRIDIRKPLNDEQVENLLASDLTTFEKTVIDAVNVEINQHQFDALVSFCFNIGTQAFYRSTLRKQLNKGRYDAVTTQMRRWVRAGGRVIKGLKNRREVEIALFNHD